MLPIQFPKNTISYWQSSVDISSFPPLKENIQTDIGIVGSGITGITLAYLLSKEGLSVTVIEANSLLSGTTGNTTAKITTQHGLIYDELIQHYGVDGAKLYYDANDRARQFMKETIELNEIAAKFTEASSVLYTTEGDNITKLEIEYKAYEKLNIPGELTNNSELPFGTRQVLKLKGQAHFHPLGYLSYLIDKCLEHGVQFYENTRALSVDYSKKPIIVCKNDHRVVCQYVVQASHYPFFDGQQFFPLKMYADRSYALLAKTHKTLSNMYINVDQPTRSIRPVKVDDEELLIFAGENHRTGVSDASMDEHFDLLASFAEQHFKLEEIYNMWSAQDYTTIDKIPYVGPVTAEKDNVIVATGFRKWGMTNGTNAALLIRDLILQEDTEYASFFSPSRKAKFDPSIKKLFTFNTEVAKQLIKGKFDNTNEQIENLKTDDACIVMKDGDRVGVYKDNEEKIYAVDTTCTHMGCELAWNSAEKSWDCPCHGSRFSVEGHVLNGPAVRNLRNIDLKNK